MYVCEPPYSSVPSVTGDISPNVKVKGVMKFYLPFKLKISLIIDRSLALLENTGVLVTPPEEGYKHCGTFQYLINGFKQK